MSATGYRSRDQRIADEFTAEHVKCPKCGALTHVDIINNLGQCGRCFERYCVEINTGRRVPRDSESRKAVLKELGKALSACISAKEQAARLRARRDRGDEFGPAHQWVLQCCEGKTGDMPAKESA